MSSSSFSASLPRVSATSAAASMSDASKPGIGPGGRVHHHERLDPLGRAEHDLARHHAAHRVAEQAEGVEPGRVGDAAACPSTSRSSVYAAGFVGLVARPVAAVVEDDDGVIAGQDGYVIGEVLLGSAEPVHEQQAGTRRRPPRLRARHRRPS